MKICLVSQEYPPETGGGGIATQTYVKAHGLSARGHEVHVVSVSYNNPRTYEDGGAVVHRMPAPKNLMPVYEESSHWLIYSAAVAGFLTELTKKHKFDVIQFPEFGGEGFLYQTDAFRFRTSKFVVQSHGPLGMFAEYMGWPEKGSTFHLIGGFMEKMVLQHSDAILASSHCSARFCAEHYGCDLSQIDVIHSGVDLDRFSPGPRPDDQRSPRILFVGNFAGNKGFNLLVDAVLCLRKSYPDICLRMIGKAGAELVRKARKRIEAENAGRHFDILGYVPFAELPEHYAWCDFFAGPSQYEPGPGNVYLEAMACGRPVIACDSGGAPEVVLDGKTGLLIPPGDSEALQEVMTRLTEEPAFRAQLARGALEWVQEFSVPRYLDKVEAAYRKCCEQ